MQKCHLGNVYEGVQVFKGRSVCRKAIAPERHQLLDVKLLSALLQLESYATAHREVTKDFQTLCEFSWCRCLRTPSELGKNFPNLAFERSLMSVSACTHTHTRDRLLRELHPAELLIERDEALISVPDVEAFGMRCLFMVAEDDAWCLCMGHWVSNSINDLK